MVAVFLTRLLRLAQQYYHLRHSMKKFLLYACMSSICFVSYGWGQKGHDTVAFIAESHLTPTSFQAIDSLLDGYSLVYWANWLDNASHTPDFAFTKTWHYKNIDEEETFQSAVNIPEGNIVEAIYDRMNVLSSSASEQEDKVLALKMLVHFLGDIHQPLHLGHASDRGGNSHAVTFFGDSTNLHSVWDTAVLEASHAWSHTEWQREIDRLSPDEVDQILTGGTPEIWGEESFLICSDIYKSTPPGTDISYDYISSSAPIIERQLLKGGLRLADILNSIFDPNYETRHSIPLSK